MCVRGSGQVNIDSMKGQIGLSRDPLPNFPLRWGFPKITGTFLGVPMIRTIVFWGERRERNVGNPDVVVKKKEPLNVMIERVYVLTGSSIPISHLASRRSCLVGVV